MSRARMVKRAFRGLPLGPYRFWRFRSWRWLARHSFQNGSRIYKRSIAAKKAARRKG